jgi:enoyl-CoA hydratase
MTAQAKAPVPAPDESVSTERVLAGQRQILVITISRPAHRNAINVATATAVAAAMEELDADPQLAAGIVTGAGGCFSAGMDLKEFASGSRPVVAGRGFAGFVEQPPAKPLIAAVEGWALGGGFEMVLACDMAVAGRGARFGLPEVTRGLAARGGGALRLARRLPYAIAMEVVLTGAPISAARAAEYGLVNRLVPDGESLAAALDLAAVIARNAPLSVRASKRVVVESADWDVGEGFARQAEYFEPVFSSADAAEGARAFSEKRPPRWSGQ